MNRTKKISNRLFSFFFAKKTWARPSNCDVLIYHRNGSETLLPYLRHLRVEILPSVGDVINIPLLFFAVYKSIFSKGTLIHFYILSYISLAKPKLVITTVDNDPKFYTISKSSGVITAFIQNGLRDEFYFKKLVNSVDNHVDYMFLFNACIFAEYRKYISGTPVIIGSIKNNAHPKNQSKKTGSVLFISQFRSNNSSFAASFAHEYGSPISYDTHYSVEESVLPLLSSWALASKMKLRICGASSVNNEIEEEFYRNLLGGDDFEFLPRMDGVSSYAQLDTADFVVSIDSAMGYEALARGCKVAVFACRGKIFNTDSRNFGWPCNVEPKGLFWTNEMSEKEVFRILSFLRDINKEDWAEILENFKSDIVQYDLDNKLLVNLINDIFPT